MTEIQFWDIINQLDWSRTGDDDAVVAPVVAALASLTESEICSFADMLAAKLFALDTEAHARHIGEYAWEGPRGYFSVDWFLYVRCCVVANRQTFYERVVAEPISMPKDIEFETLLYVASRAWELQTGNEFEHVTPISYETFSNVKGWTGEAEQSN